MKLFPASFLWAVTAAGHVREPVHQETGPTSLQEKQERTIRVRPSAEYLNQYLNLVSRFRENDPEARRELAEWPVERVAGLLLFLADMEHEFLQAAVVLPSDLAIEAWDNDDLEVDANQRMLARELINLMEEPEKTAWLREWLLLIGYQRQRPGVQPLTSPAMDYFRQALRAAPGDAEAHLAIGSMYEAAGRIDQDPRDLNIAESHYRRAVEAEPELAEAHLRLGATILALGKADEAREELTRVLSRGGAPYLLYLTHLFLGDLHKSQSLWEEAVESYRAAVELRPDWQVACVSLSHALRRSGDRARAHEIMDICLGLSVDDPDYEDGWWRYHLGQSHHLEAILQRWHEQVMK